MTLCEATWLSFGELNISEELSMRFARKIRETIMMYVHGVDGAFAIYCQRLFNMHCLPFFDASSLTKWQVGMVEKPEKLTWREQAYLLAKCDSCKSETRAKFFKI